MKIGNRSIGPNEPPLIIAEIGINHGGSLDVAKSMVDLIVQSGCECVKHQTHIIEDEMTEEAKAIFPPNANKSIWDVMKECSLNLDEEQELKEYAENLGLIWISTPFSRMAADFLDEIDVPAFKIGSGEADNLPLINHIAQIFRLGAAPSRNIIEQRSFAQIKFYNLGNVGVNGLIVCDPCAWRIGKSYIAISEGVKEARCAKQTVGIK